MNGQLESSNQSIVTTLKCKGISSTSKSPWTNILKQVIQEYNNTAHLVTNSPPAYILLVNYPMIFPAFKNFILLFMKLLKYQNDVQLKIILGIKDYTINVT